MIGTTSFNLLRTRFFQASVGRNFCNRIARLIVCSLALSSSAVFGNDELPQLHKTSTINPLDGKSQAVTYWAPASAKANPTPLFVFLHSWSSGYKQDNSKWQAEAVKRGWIYIHPDFRGANVSLDACGSKFARQDVLDAIAMAKQKFNVDPSRIYLAGVSGGGHMAMLMAGHHPNQFSAVSAWVGIGDLPEWYRFHVKDGQPQKYAKMIRQCFGGPPGSSTAIDEQYRDRSPLYHIHQVGDLPIDIYAGVNDGHTGSVPVSHSIRPFNRIAEAHGNQPVTEEEINQLLSHRKLASPTKADVATDSSLGRRILLRRKSASSRITIFDGGHESITEAACFWLSHQQRKTQHKK